MQSPAVLSQQRLSLQSPKGGVHDALARAIDERRRTALPLRIPLAIAIEANRGPAAGTTPKLPDGESFFKMVT